MYAYAYWMLKGMLQRLTTVFLPSFFIEIGDAKRQKGYKAGIIWLLMNSLFFGFEIY